MTTFPSLIKCVSSSGVVRYALSDPWVDRYLEFVAGQARPNTLRAVAFASRSARSDRPGRRASPEER